MVIPRPTTRSSCTFWSEDKSGNLSFYANTAVWQAKDETVAVPESNPSVDFVRKKGKFFTDNTGITEAKPTKYSEHTVMVLRAKRSGGRHVPSRPS